MPCLISKQPELPIDPPRSWRARDDDRDPPLRDNFYVGFDDEDDRENEEPWDDDPDEDEGTVDDKPPDWAWLPPRTGELSGGLK